MLIDHVKTSGGALYACTDSLAGSSGRVVVNRYAINRKRYRIRSEAREGRRREGNIYHVSNTNKLGTKSLVRPINALPYLKPRSIQRCLRFPKTIWARRLTTGSEKQVITRTALHIGIGRRCIDTAWVHRCRCGGGQLREIALSEVL